MLHFFLTVLTPDVGPTETLSFWEVTATGDVYRPKIGDGLENTPDIEKVNYSKINWIDRDEFVELRGVGRLPLGGLSQNPVVCGSMQCGIFAKSQSDEITMLKRSVLGTAAACLYNAVRNEGYLDLQWQDMELLIENYDSAEIFDGEPPKDAKEYHDHFARSIDSYCIKGTAKKRKSQVSEILKPFEKLLCQTDPAKTEISVDVVEEFLHQTADLQGIRRKKQDALRDHWNKDHTLKPTELLTLLKECLNENEPLLHFNHYAFYKSCFLLLTLVEKELCDEFNDFMSSLPFPFRGHMDEDFSWLAAMVFKEFHVTMEPKHGPPPDKWLVRVAGVFKKFLKKYAGKPDGKINRNSDDEGVRNGVCIHWGSCKRLGTIHSAWKG